MTLTYSLISVAPKSVLKEWAVGVEMNFFRSNGASDFVAQFAPYIFTCTGY